MGDVFLITHKVTSAISLHSIQLKWADSVRDDVPEAPIIIVGTHCDKKQDEVEGQHSDVRLAKIAKEVGAEKCFEVSAKDGTNVENLLHTAVELGLQFRQKKDAKKRKGKCALL